jgi:drug/metabolite transporter (DMT)-like permease
MHALNVCLRIYFVLFYMQNVYREKYKNRHGSAFQPHVEFRIHFWKSLCRILSSSLLAFREVSCRRNFPVVYCCGVLVIMLHSLNGAGLNGIGIVLALLAAISFSMGTVLFKKAPLTTVSLYTTVGYQTLVGGITLFGLGLLLENPAEITLTLPLAGSLLYLVLIVSIGATLLWFSLVLSSSASSASSYHYLNPVFGIGLAWLLLNEPLSLQDAGGTMLVILGIMAITRSTEAVR